MSLRQPGFVRWSVYTEECLDILSAEPPALPSDVWLCDLIRLQRIAEAGSLTFAMDDPGAIITLRDMRTQYQLQGFRQQLEYWRRHAKSDLSLREYYLPLRLSFFCRILLPQLPHSSNPSRNLPTQTKPTMCQAHIRHITASTDIFIHEIALHPEHDIDDLRSPLRIPAPPSLDELTLKFKDIHFIPAREEALFATLAAIHECFDSFLSLPVATACMVPNLFFVRTGYAARALRKLLNICDSQAEFEGKAHIDVRDLRFEEYLTKLISLLAKVHSENNATIPRAFGLVLMQIKSQAMQSSKLLQSIRPPEESGDTKKKEEDPEATFSLEPEDLNDPRCPLPTVTKRILSTTATPSTNPSNTPFPPAPPKGLTSNTSPLPPRALPETYLPFALPLDPQLQMDPSQWHRADDQDDAFMTGIDVLQWFEQDFALDAAGLVEYDGVSGGGGLGTGGMGIVATGVGTGEGGGAGRETGAGAGGW